VPNEANVKETKADEMNHEVDSRGWMMLIRTSGIISHCSVHTFQTKSLFC